MAEFFLELFSEEIPSGLQKNLRENLLEEFQKFFLEKSIKSKKSLSLSTPNRLIIVFEGLEKQIIKSQRLLEGLTDSSGSDLSEDSSSSSESSGSEKDWLRLLVANFYLCCNQVIDKIRVGLCGQVDPLYDIEKN